MVNPHAIGHPARRYETSFHSRYPRADPGLSGAPLWVGPLKSACTFEFSSQRPELCLDGSSRTDTWLLPAWYWLLHTYPSSIFLLRHSTRTFLAIDVGLCPWTFLLKIHMLHCPVVSAFNSCSLFAAYDTSRAVCERELTPFPPFPPPSPTFRTWIEQSSTTLLKFSKKPFLKRIYGDWGEQHKWRKLWYKIAVLREGSKMRNFAVLGA